MTDLAIPKCRIELFSKPAFFTDHFLKDTSLTYATATYDGDQVQVNVDAGDPFGQGQLYCDMPGTSINSNPKRYLVVRVTEFTPVAPGDHYWIGVTKLGSGSVGEQHTTIGLKILDLKTLNSNVDFDFTSFCLDFIGDHSTVTLDYVAIVEGVDLLPFPVEDDLVGQMTIINSVLNKGANFMSLTIQNFENANASKITENSVVICWLSRDSETLGTMAAKAFGGRIKKITPNALGYNKYYIDVECHGHAIELIKPPSRHTKVHNTVNGRTIIEEVLALAVYVAKHPTASKWFDNTGSTGSTDDQINSMHNKSYTRSTPWEVIKELLDLASNPSLVVGFDIFEMPSGALVGHLRNSLDFVSDVTSLTPETFSKIIDVHTVINHQQIFGRDRFQIGDAEWDDSNTNWTARIGTLESPNPGYILIDNYGKECEAYRTMFPYDLLSADQTKTPEPECVNHVYCQLLMGDGNVADNTLWIIFECDTIDDYFYHTYTNVTQLLNYTVDEDLGDANTGAGKFWTKYGDADWNKIKRVVFYGYTISGDAMYITIDHLKITPLRFMGEAEDATSQTAYGVVDGEPQIDETLASDEECAARATSIVGAKKDPLITLENVVTDGSLSYKPSYRQRIVVSDLSIDETHRIIEVQHTVQGAVWDSKLIISAESQAIDLAFRVASERIKMLEGRA